MCSSKLIASLNRDEGLAALRKLPPRFGFAAGVVPRIRARLRRSARESL